MKKQIIKIGFDLDGVLLYNPLRIARPFIALFKQTILKKKNRLEFYYPKTKIEKFFWSLIHLSSIFIAAGVEEIKKMAQKKEIEAYIITGRYSFLKKDFYRWLKKMKINHYFKGAYYNKKDEQPHLFKEKIIKKLNLDIFIEDNWDIVKYLSKKIKKTKIFWIYNIFDRKIKYQYKFPTLEKTLKKIQYYIPNKYPAKKLKVLIATDYYYPHWTGISKSIYNLTYFLKKDFNFTILTTRYNKKLKKNETINEIKIIRKDYLFGFSRVKYSLSLVLKFLSIIKNYDIVFLNSPFSNILALSLISKIFNKKLLIFHQGDLILPKSFTNKIIEKIFFISTYIALKLANKVSTYTTDYALNSQVLKYFLNKFTPLIIPPLYRPSNTEKKFIKNNKKIIFGFAGRFVEEKGFDILFEAIPKILQKIPNSRFVFAGEINIDYEQFFKKNLNKFKKIKAYVTLFGLLKDKQLINFYKTIHFIIIPSRSDCFPLVQAEAMLYGNPSIVSDIPGARYLVRKTNFGITFKKENPQDLAEKIIFAVKNKNNLFKNYKNVLKILDIKENVKKIKKFIGE